MTSPAPDIKVTNLTYTFRDHTPGLHNLTLSLPPQSRTLLIGANGAGKTTLLRLLSGRSLSPANTIAIGGHDPFTTGLEGVTYLGTEWVLNPIVRTDMDVPTLLRSVGGDAFPARRAELLRVLDVDLGWRMHAVSDGERRRVQLAMGLLRPWRVLLLDEVTVDLDLLSRARLLAYLRRETEGRGATVVYATHIMDGLGDWPTHLVHMALGRVRKFGGVEEMYGAAGAVAEAGAGLLGALVLKWLQEDLDERGPRTGGEGGQGKTYQSYEGLGGYGQEKRPEKLKG